MGEYLILHHLKFTMSKTELVIFKKLYPSFHFPVSVNGIFILVTFSSLLQSISSKSANPVDSFKVLVDIPSPFSYLPLKLIQVLSVLNEMYFAKVVFVFVLWSFRLNALEAT